MNISWTYLLEANIYLTVSWIIYRLLLQNKTFLNTNRWYLIGSLITSFLLPLMPSTAVVLEPEIIVNLPEFSFLTSSQEINNTTPLLHYGYWAGVGFLALFVLSGLGKIILTIYKGRRKKAGSAVLVFTDSNTPVSSFFHFIFWNSNLEKEVKASIYQHEMAHIRQMHTLDLLIMWCIIIFSWFNPFVFLYRKSLSEVHEFLADRDVIKNTTSRHTYSKIILGQALGINQHLFSHAFFNHKQIKQRLKMMTRQKSKKSAGGLYFAALALFASCFVMVSCSKQDDPAGTSNSEVFTTVDEMPTFPGGDAALYAYLGENIVYPENAKSDAVEGKVYVSFVVSKEGNIENVEVLKSPDERLSESAIKVISSMPKWNPGIQDNESVNVKYTLPILYSLK